MRRNLVVLAVFAALIGCAGEVRDLRWAFTFGDEGLSARAAVVEGRILAGGCTGSVVYAATVSRGEMPPMPASLGAGHYGFEGIARDASCIEYARGCLEVDLPRTDEDVVAVRLLGTPERAMCAASCTAGRCDVDAATLDAGLLDAPRDAPFDAPSLDAPSLDARADTSGSDGGRVLAVSDRIDIDFGPTAATGWVMHGALAGTTGPLVSVAGVSTDVSVTTRAFSGEQTGGSTVNELGLPPEVSSDSLWVGDFAGHDAALLLDAEVVLEGLGSGRYSLVLFASRLGDDGGPGRLTRYTIGGTSVDLDAEDNTSRVATFTDVTPDASGAITVHVGASPAGTARFGYIGSLSLTRVP